MKIKFLETLIVLIFSLTLFSCSEKINTEYKTISYDFESYEIESHLKVPNFMDENLSELNKIVAQRKEYFDKNNIDLQNLWNDWHNAGLNFDPNTDIPLPQFYYNEDFKITYSGHLISILFTITSNSGNETDDMGYISYCFDTKKKKLCGIEDATGMSKRTISEKCMSILSDMTLSDSEEDIGSWLLKGAGIEAVDDMIFTIDNGEVTIHFLPYEVSASDEPLAIKIN